MNNRNTEITIMELIEVPKSILEDIRMKQEKIAELKALAEKTTSVLRQIPGRGSGGSGHQMEDLVAKKMLLEDQITRDYTRFVMITLEITDLLDAVDNLTQRRALSMAYLELVSQQEIASRLLVSVDYVRVLLSRGKKTLEQVYRGKTFSKSA